MSDSPWQVPEFDSQADDARAERRDALRSRRIAAGLVLGGFLLCVGCVFAELPYLIIVGIPLCLVGSSRLIQAQRILRGKKGLSGLLRPVPWRPRVLVIVGFLWGPLLVNLGVVNLWLFAPIPILILAGLIEATIAAFRVDAVEETPAP